jgi:hypothetical protein
MNCVIAAIIHRGGAILRIFFWEGIAPGPYKIDSLA